MPASQTLPAARPLRPAAAALVVGAEARLAAQLGRAVLTGQRLLVALIQLENLDSLAASAGGGTVERILVGLERAIGRRLEGAGECLWSGHGELLVMQPLRAGLARARDLAHDLARLVNGPFPAGGRAVLVRARIGVAMFPGDGVDAAALLRHARFARHHAARDPRRRPQFFCGAMADRLVAEQRLAEDLRAALDQGELALAFQPQLDIASGRVFAAEALLRWRHRRRGWVSPAEFVPIAERSGLIHTLGRWVLREACRVGASWHAQGHRLGIAVNLSPEQLSCAEIVAEVEEALGSTGMPAPLLVLEVTESILLRDPDTAARALDRLRRRGVRVALDDFGAGHSGIGYLRSLPLDQLKIDRCLVGDLAASGEAPPLLRAVVAMGRSLGLQVLAEGVETARQLDGLRQIGCDAAQGYLIGQPMPAEDLVATLPPAAAPHQPRGSAAAGSAVRPAAIAQASQASATPARMSAAEASARPSPIQASSTGTPA